MTAPNAPLIELEDIRKSYGGGDSPSVEVLHGLTLTIRAGEFVAIMGTSGSGKSTLMHILGCLDRPTSGTYRFAGRDIGAFDADELAWLRREAFGFVFQGYHLIRTLDALRNVEMPAVYAGTPAPQRDARARRLLERLGLGDRLEHRPNQLSGGQQQRVSIARALMNGGRIILADEPTGALDSKSGAEVMALLTELADAGHAVILITHDRDVASRARRIVEIHDGAIVADSASSAASATASTASASASAASTADDRARVREIAQTGSTHIDAEPPTPGPAALFGDTRDFMAAMAAGVARNATPWADAREAMRTAWHVMWTNRFRTLLTLLGIVIGVSSVIVMLAIGLGTQEQVIAKMATFGTNRIYVVPGSSSPREPGGTLTVADVAIIRDVPHVKLAMPFAAGDVTVRAGNVDVRTHIWSVTTDAEEILHWKPSRGLFFTDEDERELAPVMLLGKKAREKLFGEANPVGRYVLVNNVPFQVIGELEEKGAVSGDKDDDDVVLTPFSTGSRRVIGDTNLSWISVLIDDLDNAPQVTQHIKEALTKAHHIEDFGVYDQAAAVRAQQQTQRTLTLLLGLIAAVSLVVGGIGVMNIMLMTVKERTREIGIRMATGARQRDILRQFLTEAMLVSLVGGVTGTVLGLAIGSVLILFDAPVIFSVRGIVAAFACALATGLVFGFAPARQAARLDPVVALASE
ncbi:MacB family efflux pump subunit [Pararobbsia silviterrae]|uniref:Pyoverdine export ATP-binding/permease protein PvdT n=1 Tax=Pararobbsia silviterrae TaxID=1792498 RepID=A0A494XAI5_9BURK|nr:MacB family efflux pump subunit [Pararobbsia silviterrae]RKP47102.1 MacB family efflux pump subunit [Pararobbsia silviterrae]